MVDRGRTGAGLALAGALAAGMALAQAPAPAVTVAPAEIAPLQETGVFTGRVRAVQKVDIRARVNGFVEERQFTEGARVEAGAPLFRIEDEAYAAAVAEIEASIESTRAELRLAEIERDRKATLVERESVARSELDIAEAQLGKVEGQLAGLEAKLRRAKLDLSYTEITAPFAGRTGLAAADEGDLVGPEFGPLTSLTRLDPIQVEFPVASALWLDYRRAVAAGEAAEEAAVTLSLANGQIYEHRGDIDFVDAAVSEGTDTVLVRAEFPNPENLLLDSALVRVELAAAQPQEVLTVPSQSVQRDMAGPFVMVVGGDSKVELRRVETGLTAMGRTEIRSGLEQGERVITEGVNKVRPGVTVDAAEAAEG